MFLTKYKNKSEPFLEPIFRELRFNVALVDLKRVLNKNSLILDYGCGPEAKFCLYLKDKNLSFKKYFGYDPLTKKDINKKNLFITSNFKTLQKYRFDIITMFAVLEHLPYPDFNFKPILDLLNKEGFLFLTTPTKLAKPVLEFLSFKLNIISRREIEEHQHYFSLDEIEKLFKKYGLKVDRRKTFELRMNNYVLLKNVAKE